jgi:hypothetical protein
VKLETKRMRVGDNPIKTLYRNGGDPLDVTTATVAANNVKMKQALGSIAASNEAK